jgi:hypothetical protein
VSELFIVVSHSISQAYALDKSSLNKVKSNKENRKSDELCREALALKRHAST